MSPNYFNKTSPMFFKHCKTCTKRYPGCQDTCKEYAEDLAEYSAYKAKTEPEIDKYVSSGVKARLNNEAIFKKKMSKVKRAR